MAEFALNTVGVLGAGKVGTGIARQALAAGFKVLVATRKPPEEIRLIVDIMAPGAESVTSEELAARSDLIVLAIPLKRLRTLDPGLLAGKVVIDAMNYWADTDGAVPDFECDRSSSEVVQDYLPETRVVRALNHVGYHELVENALPAGHPDRQAMAVVGNDPDARRLVAAFVERLGFDAVDGGDLTAARKTDVGTPIFGARLDRSQMERMLGRGLEAGSRTAGNSS